MSEYPYGTDMSYQYVTYIASRVGDVPTWTKPTTALLVITKTCSTNCYANTMYQNNWQQLLWIAHWLENSPPSAAHTSTMTLFWLAVRLGREDCINARDFQVGKMLSCYYVPGSAYSLIDSHHQGMTLWMPQQWPMHCNKESKVI